MLLSAGQHPLSGLGIKGGRTLVVMVIIINMWLGFGNDHHRALKITCRNGALAETTDAVVLLGGQFLKQKAPTGRVQRLEMSLENLSAHTLQNSSNFKRQEIMNAVARAITFFGCV